MQPQKPYTTPTNSGQEPLPVNPVLTPDQYDFILNPVKPPKPSIVASSSIVKRAAFFLGIVIILFIIGIILISALSGSSGKFTPITTVLQYQTELLRIATNGETNASQESTKEVAINLDLSMRSARSQLTTYLAQNGQKVSTTSLTLKRSTAADTQLTTALANSTYDTTFITIIQNDLISYEKALQTAYNANPGPKGRTILSNQFDGASLLLKQINQ